MIKPKNKGSGIMVSDFMDDYLCLTQEKYVHTREVDFSTVCMEARCLAEYGKA